MQYKIILVASVVLICDN